MKMQKNHAGKSQFGIVVSVLLWCIILFGAVTAFRKVESGYGYESRLRLEDAVKKAVISCYAIEGRYPPTLEYMEEYYGLQINKERYAVFYEVFADNIMPEITVTEK